MVKEFSELFKAYSKFIGINENLTNKIIFIILFVGFCLTVLTTLYAVFKRVLLFFQQRRINKDLHPFFTPTDVRNATKFFIPTKYQNISPSEDEEPSRKYIASAKNKILPLFLNKVFPFGKTDNKYYLILADSGMGKTTFLLNLYIRYKNKVTTIFSLKRFEIKLIPIWHQDAMDYISKIKDPENTILLLDAFDESVAAQKDYFRTLKNILLKVSQFRIVVMTCRTQFFPSQKEEPHETGYFTAGERGEFYFQKLYLSVFDDRDVSKYLKNRFPFIWQRANYLKAKSIAKKCPNLVIRPMLLNYIEDLLDKEKVFEFPFQVYEALINNWIRRESRKSGIKEKYENEMRFIKLLIKFSEKLAINLYSNRDVRGGYHIARDEQFNEGILTLKGLEELNDDDLDENDSRARSLLSRNAVGDYKFSHKSILEYFLSKAFFNKQLAFETFDFFGMDMAKEFHSEMLVHKLRTLNGNFVYKEDTYTRGLKNELSVLNLDRITEVIHLTIYDFACIQPSQLSIFKNLKTLTLVDENDMEFVYKIYLALEKYFNLLQDRILKQDLPKGEKQKWYEMFTNIEGAGYNNLKNHFQSLGFEGISILVDTLSLNKIKNDTLSSIRPDINSITLNSGELKIPNEILGKINLLQTLLPHCKIYF